MRVKDSRLLTEIKNYIDDYCNNFGCGPTVREVAKKFGMSVGNAQNYIMTLRKQGSLVSGPVQRNESKEYSLDRDTTKVEFIGGINCGALAEESQENRGYLRLPRAFVGSGEFFLLQAKGDSMVGAGIESGDLILIKRQSYAEAGQIIVALYENENTLKRLCYDNKKHIYFLHPENAEYDDIYLDNIQVQGVATKIIKEIK